MSSNRHVLHLSEHEAYNRMEAVHAARRFPVILALLAEGRLHLTAVCLLAPRLGDENHLALLGGAIHKSKREVEELLARWFSKVSIPPSVRKIPVAGRAPVTTAAAESLVLTSPVAAASMPQAARPTTVPLSADRYQVKFTATAATIAKLRRAQELLSHTVPDGDVGAIVDRALTVLLEQAARQKHAATNRPRGGRALAAASRHVPAAVEREVWERDGGQCAFVAGNGRRCEERKLVEFHHAKPWAAGGLPTSENIALRCRAHNAYEASLYFGPIRAALHAWTRSGTSLASGPIRDPDWSPRRSIP